jgi:hypothetical protein
MLWNAVSLALKEVELSYPLIDLPFVQSAGWSLPEKMAPQADGLVPIDLSSWPLGLDSNIEVPWQMAPFPNCRAR